ncbi:hypothetical protein DCAR_0726836 [Daucus carota subsp. sativus]|uniref:Bidirectional sugar transporter SWEET n=1 Tax=Daucus carota subsp. sativus TaxID=79200 RepID=A0A161WPN4_DAUCS|nr:PREDICTED: bidirectional sugar transporter SWEET6a-like [Daucus carota subsp. sativus]WOH07406.1 hypothetical protein DCAR_0726836 [Daucus carota subsp. sativus]
MVNTDAIRTAVGIVGDVISAFLFLSPSPTFYRIFKKKSVEEFQPVPYLLTMINCLFWVLYGTPLVHPGNILVLIINGFGIVMELFYLSMFLIYAKDNKQRLRVGGILLLEFVVYGIFAGLLIGLEPSVKKRSRIVGTICIVLNIGMYGAPLTIARKVIKTKSVEYMPFWLSLTGTINGACWLCYGLLRFDVNLVVPNGLGFTFGVMQLVLYAIYWKRTPKSEDDKKVVQLQGGVV